MISPTDSKVRHIVTTPIETQVYRTIEYMKEIAKGLKALNEANLLHNDIKPENILIDQDTGKVVISDFDTVCTLDTGRSIAKPFGTIRYIYPRKMSKNVSTELYSLALTYEWIDPRGGTYSVTSFMDVFNSLYKVAERDQLYLSAKINKLRTSLRALCSKMKEGVESPRGPTITYDEIISILSSMETRFTSQRGSTTPGRL